MNKYTSWYKNITNNAKNRSITGYTEKHHIIPKSLGGSDSESNIVALTAREHFICHWLLTKTTTGTARQKMIYALRVLRANNPNQQRYETKITSRVYENIKKEYSEIQSEKVSGSGNPMYGDKFYRSNEGKRSQSAGITGDKNGSKQPEARAKISASKLGKKRAPFSNEWKQRLSESSSGENNSMYGKKHSEETKKKMSLKAKGRKQSLETIKKKADALRGTTRPKKQCPHCKKMIAVNTYPRWHGDNCKSKVH